jgi:hypothetical protein
MKTLLVLLTCCLLLQQTIAQQNGISVRGTIINEQKTPVQGATVELLSVENQKKIAAGLTDSAGHFSLKGVKKGNYLLTITSVGYKKFTSPAIAINTDTEEMEVPAYTILRDDYKNLQAVEVRAKKSLLEHEADRTIVNVEAMMSAATSNTLEVLEKTPGVIVNSDGSISLNGKTGVMVLIDGRQTYMSGQALSAYLKSLPGSTLDKIELISNPPARYDAEGSAIINIKLKKNVLKGVNGNIALGYSLGKTSRSNNSLNLNFGKNKFNYFTNLSFGLDGDYADDKYDRRYFDGNDKQTSTVLLNNYSRYSSRNTNARVGMDYAVTDKTNIGVIFNFSNRPSKDRFNYDSKAYDASSMLDSIATGGNNTRSRSNNFNANINFLHKFKKPGRELSAEMNYLNYHTNASRSLYADVFTASGDPVDNRQFLYEFPSDIRIFNGQIDYVHPVKGNIRIDAGVKGSTVENNSIFDHYDHGSSGFVKDERKSDNFLYEEKIAAAYLSARKNYKRVSVQLGARYEHTNLSGKGLTSGGSSFSRDFNSFFPSFFISYKLDSAARHTLNFNMARRIRRPNYQQLNPFLFYQDEYSYNTGNPDLKPSYQQQFELGYRYRQLFGITLMNNRVTDIIFNTTKAEGEIFINKPANVSKGQLFVLSTNLNLSPTKWWKSNSNIAGGVLWLDGMADTEKLNPKLFSWRINLQQQFRISPKWNAELAIIHFGGDVQGQTIVDPRWRMNSSVQLSVLKNKGSIRLSAEDLFRSWKRKDETVALARSQSYHIGYTDTRRVGLAFTWSFGKREQKNKREHSEKLGDEKERM